MRIAVVDCLACGVHGRRLSSVDVIGSGPRLVVGILRKLGVDSSLMECHTALSNGDRSLSEFDVLMVSGMSSDARSMAMVLRKWGGRGPSFAGGPACVDYDKLLDLGFTAVVWGEAELSLPALVDGLKAGDISRTPNLIYRYGSKTVSNVVGGHADEPLLWSFEPDTESIKNYRYYWASRVYVEVVRGCSNFYRTVLPVLLPRSVKCSGCGLCKHGDLNSRISCPLGIPPGCGYCLVPSLYGPARSRPVKSIVKEVEGLIELGVLRIVLSAPDILDYGRDWLVKPKTLTDPRSPPANTDALEELLNSVFSIPKIARGEVYVMVENVKPNLVTEEVARVLGRYLKGTTVNIGLETGDEEHHVSLGRPSTVEEVLKSTKLLREAGLRPYVYVIHGLPGETWRTVRKTIKTLRKVSKLGAERVILYRFRPLKGTAFGGYPPPRFSSPRSEALKKFVKALEASFKKELLEKVIRVAIVDSRGRGLYVGYTLPHGPVAIVISSKDLRNNIVDAKVVKVGRREVMCELVAEVSPPVSMERSSKT